MRKCLPFLFLLVTLSCWTIATANCPIECRPNGKCVTEDNRVFCKCNPGFAGYDCSFPYVQCNDGFTRCYNGAQCVRGISNKDPTDSDGRTEEYECDCSSIPNGSQFIIQQCENPVDDVCEMGVETSHYAFCTNAGTCRRKVESGSAHPGCHCPAEFEGRHCQYRNGTAPPEELRLVWNDESLDENPIKEFAEEPKNVDIWIVSAVIVVLIASGVFAYFVQGRLKQISDTRFQKQTLDPAVQQEREKFDDIVLGTGEVNVDDDEEEDPARVII